MLLQHYHTLSSLSKKLDASFQFLQLQLGTPNNPLTLSFDKWGHLAPLSWVVLYGRFQHSTSYEILAPTITQRTGPGPHGTYLQCRTFKGGHQKSQSLQGDATVHIFIRHGQWSQQTENISKALYSIRAHSNANLLTVSPRKTLQKGIGTSGLLSGTTTRPLEGN